MLVVVKRHLPRHFSSFNIHVTNTGSPPGSLQLVLLWSGSDPGYISLWHLSTEIHQQPCPNALCKDEWRYYVPMITCQKWPAKWLSWTVPPLSGELRTFRANSMALEKVVASSLLAKFNPYTWRASRHWWKVGVAWLYFRPFTME